MWSIIRKIRAEGGYSVLLGKVADGRALTRIALDDYQCSRHTLYKILHRSKKLWDLFLAARRESAMALAEEGLGIADALKQGSAFTREDVAAAKLRIDQRMAMAKAYDREIFGEPVASAMLPALSIGSLYLQVLQKANAPAALKSGNALPVKEAEVVSEEPSHG
jgi:hypothetical protein